LSFDIVQSTRHHGDDQNLKPISNTPSSVSLVIPPSLLSPEIKPDNKVKVFYNLFTKSVKDAERVQGIVNEQLSLLLSEHHELFSITSFGYKLPLPNIPNNYVRFLLKERYRKNVQAQMMIMIYQTSAMYVHHECHHYHIRIRLEICGWHDVIMYPN
jgi:hypothetical protein